jgi:uncharacterized protein
MMDIDEVLDAAFKPHAAIENPDDFLGRANEISRVQMAIKQTGLHVVIYGERGAGKTSLANVCTVNINRLRIFCSSSSTFDELCKSVVLRYIENLRETGHSVDDIVFEGSTGRVQFRGTTFNTANLNGDALHHILPKDVKLVIIFDELDRLEDSSVLERLAELSKMFSTLHTNVTLVFIGVASSVDDLLAGHASNIRNFQQVLLGQMPPNELSGIITRGEDILKLSFTSPVKERIVMLSDGYPYYLHLIATNAARVALEQGSSVVDEEQFISALKTAAQNIDQSLRVSYEDAILSKSEIFRKVLWALAALPNKIHPLGDIIKQIKQISPSTNVSPQNVGGALKQLAREGRSSVITSPRHGQYSFSNPLMKGFIRILMEQHE